MKHEYTMSEFRTVVDTLTKLVPEMHIVTDIICRFLDETDEYFAQTVSLIKEYRFPQLHISQFYPRPGTPAARMKKVPSIDVKKRSRELTSIFESFSPYQGWEGRVERIWITEIATDGIHLVGHTKGYVQVLVVAPESMLGTSTCVEITSVGRWSVFGDVIEMPTEMKEDSCQGSSLVANSYNDTKPVEESSPCTNCTCSAETDPRNLPLDKIRPNIVVDSSNTTNPNERSNSNPVQSLLLRRRTKELEKNNVIASKEHGVLRSQFAALDWILLGGMVVSSVVIMALVLMILPKKLSF